MQIQLIYSPTKMTLTNRTQNDLDIELYVEGKAFDAN